MLRYSKSLSLALLISLPILAMDKDKAIVPASPCSDLTSTTLVLADLTRAKKEQATLEKQIDELQAQKRAAASLVSAAAVNAQKRYDSKSTEIAGIKALILQIQQEMTNTEASKSECLAALKKNYEKSRDKIEQQLTLLTQENNRLLEKYHAEQAAKEKEYDETIRALAAQKANKETKLANEGATLATLHEELASAQSEKLASAQSGKEESSGILAWFGWK